jgi:hypothetical protein
MRVPVGEFGYRLEACTGMADCFDDCRYLSIQTTELYLGSEQEIAIAINDNLGL